MKTRNEAALSAKANVLYALEMVLRGELSPDSFCIEFQDVLRAALTHEDAPVGEVGEELLDKPLNALGLLCSAIRCGQDWDKYCDKARETLLRAHSQQKDVGKPRRCVHCGKDKKDWVSCTACINSENQPMRKVVEALERADIQLKMLHGCHCTNEEYGVDFKDFNFDIDRITVLNSLDSSSAKYLLFPNREA